MTTKGHTASGERRCDDVREDEEVGVEEGGIDNRIGGEGEREREG